ncbi:MAG TPA: Type 1 glutamine amidotransferase-like domain-containing protein [Candidatus Obscuribacterales bacterium]
MPSDVALTIEDERIPLTVRQALGAAAVPAMQMLCGANGERRQRAARRDHTHEKNSFLGTLFLDGGGDSEAVIGDIANTSGGDATVAICSHASPTPIGTGNRLRQTFIKAGIKAQNIAIVIGEEQDKLPEDKPPHVEHDATRLDDARYVNKVPEDATVLFFSGGDQERLMRQFKESDAVRDFLGRGGIVGGTSAGEMIAGDLMIAGGMRDGILRRNELKIAQGMGLMHGAFFESHAGQRERGDSRALAALALRNEMKIGFVVDERTYLRIHNGAAVVGGENNVKVVTRGRHFSSNLANDDGRPPYVSGGSISNYRAGNEIKIPNWARMDGKRLDKKNWEIPTRFKD